MHADLARIVGAEHVLPGDDPRYVADQTAFSAIRGVADAVVLPADCEQVAQVVAWCHEHGVPVIPRGGGTGWAGGAVPLGSGVVVALERLTRVRALDPLQWRMEVEAGVTTATVRRLARENGLCFPPDPGAAEQSQIGGNVATNAGGPHCFKYGVTGAWVTGVEAVLVARRARPRRRRRAQGRRRLRPARAARRLRGHARDHHRGMAAADPRARGLVAGRARSTRDAAGGRRGGRAGDGRRARSPRRSSTSTRARCGSRAAASPAALPAGAGFLVIAESDTRRRRTATRSRRRSPRTRSAPVVLPPRPGRAVALARRRRPRRHARCAAASSPTTSRCPSSGSPTRSTRSRRSASGTGSRRARGGTPATATCTRRSCSTRATTSPCARARRAADELLAMAIEMGGTISGEHGDRRAEERLAAARSGRPRRSPRTRRSRTRSTRAGSSTRGRSWP